MNISANAGVRQMKCYANHLSVEAYYRYGSDRQKALEELPKNLLHQETEFVKRLDTWRNQTGFEFVLSPHGNGLDCHRTWEAICLGCIPIVRRSKMSDGGLFDDLPVLIVEEWSDVTLKMLEETSRKFSRHFTPAKLTMQYWVDRIRDSSRI